MIDTSKLDEPRWYVLHTFTGYENMAVDNLNKCIIKNNLQDYIMEVKVPMETVIEEDKNGKKKAVERKLFPCYILIKMRYTDSLWHTIVNSRGVTGFVGPQGRPLPLTDEEVKDLEDFVIGMQDEAYETVDGRPLVYTFGGCRLDFVERVRVLCKAKGFPEPYFAGMLRVSSAAVIAAFAASLSSLKGIITSGFISPENCPIITTGLPQ